MVLVCITSEFGLYSICYNTEMKLDNAVCGKIKGKFKVEICDNNNFIFFQCLHKLIQYK